jgi:hypothetical protein
MIIWRGLGILVPIFGLLLGWSSCAVGYLIDPNSNQLARICVVGGELIASLAIYLVARYFKTNNQSQKIGAFFYIPTQYWIIILPAISILVSIIGNFPPNAQSFWTESFSLS